MKNRTVSELSQISQLVSAACSHRINNNEKELLAKLSIEIAKAYLRVRERHGYRIRETKDEHEFESIASDCIADLFKHDKDGRLRYFTTFFTPYLEKESSDEEIAIALRRLITQRVKQYLTKIFAQRDPEAAKLLRNIRLAALRHKALRLTKDTVNEYIFITPDNKSTNKAQAINRPNNKEIEYAIGSVFKADLTIDQLVLKTLEVLSDYSNSSVEVPIDSLAIVIRQFRAAIQVDDQLASVYDPSYFQRELELRGEVKRILSIIKTKIATRYIDKNKLTLQQGIAMFSALELMAEDALQGNRLKENYSYLQEYMPSISREEYFASTRKIFEYFVRQFKNSIRESIINNSD